MLFFFLAVVDPPKLEVMEYVADAQATSGQEKSKEKDQEKDKRDEKPPITVTMK